VSVDWSDLQYFLATAQTGSLHAAARRLALRHSTLSRRMTRLERELGTVLFQRGGRGSVLTPRGEARFRYLAGIGLQIDAASRDAAEESVEMRGSVRVATAGIFANAFLAQHLPELAAAQPQLEVVLLVDTAFADLADGSVDLAVRLLPEGRPPAAQDVRAKRVGYFAFALYASKDYLLRHPPQEGWLGHRIVAYRGARSPGQEWINEHAQAARPLCSTNTVTVVAELVAAGHAIGVLPDFYAARFDSLVRMSGDIARNTIWLLVRPEMKRSRSVLAFHRFLTQLIGGHFGS
jgi:DNA-binding transcriptional LysR family regulator